MPAPTNISAATATVIASLPASISQNVHDAGTTYTVWYKYTPVASEFIGLWGFGGSAGVGYRPTTTVFVGTGSTALGIGVTNKPIQVYCNAGQTYWFRFLTNSGTISPAVLDIEAEVHAPQTIPVGSILVNDDTTGGPGIILSAVNGDDYNVLDAISPFPAGESGDVLRASGRLLMEDDTGDLEMYDANLTALGSVAVDISGATDLIRANQTLNQWFVGISTVASIRIVNEDGSLGALHTLPNTGLTALTASNDGSIIYIAGQVSAVSTPIQRWLTGSSALDTDLVAGVSGYKISSLLTLEDDSILALYIEDASPHEIYIKRYAAGGSTVHTYSVASNASSLAPRLAYALEMDSFWVWFHETPGSTPGISTFREYDLGGSVLREIEYVDYENGAYAAAETDTPIARFGMSQSCPFLILGGLTIDPPSTDQSTPCPCPTQPGGPGGPGPLDTIPNPIGPLPPWVAMCEGGCGVDSVSDVSIGEVWL